MSSNIINIDKYTKIVLTVIAVMLVAIVIKLYFLPTEASAKPNVMDVNIKYIDGRSLSNGIISVNLEQIDGRNIYNNLPIDLKAIDGQGLSRNVIPIDLKNVNSHSITGSEIPVKIVK